MLSRLIKSAVSLAVPVLIFVACNDGPPPAPQTPTSEHLTQEIPPCTPAPGSAVDPCDPDATMFAGGIGQSSPDLGAAPRSLREMLNGSTTPPAWVPHLVLRGAYLPDTVRCTATDVFRPPVYLSDEFGFDTPPRGFKCYADVHARAYIVGSGPSILTVLLFHYIYWDGDYAPDAESGQTEQDVVEELRLQFQADIDEAFSGREHIIFLGPPVDLSSEAWQVMGIWDVLRKTDGTVIAAHPNRSLWASAKPDEYQTHLGMLEMELPAFTQVVSTAQQARVAEYGGRIGEDEDLPNLVINVNDLRDYYIDVGAYDHPDGPPAQPPPPTSPRQ